MLSVVCCPSLSVTHFWKLSRNARVFWLAYDMTIVSGLAYDLFGGQKVNWFCSGLLILDHAINTGAIMSIYFRENWTPFKLYTKVYLQSL